MVAVEPSSAQMGQLDKVMRHHLRIARPVNSLIKSTEMYRDGLGLSVLGQFRNHDGFDGVMLGDPESNYHFEFTIRDSHPIIPTPTEEDLAVFYIADLLEWNTACKRMHSVGFRSVTSLNPYWTASGLTFEDNDGYRVVLQNGSWNSTANSSQIKTVRAVMIYVTNVESAFTWYQLAFPQSIKNTVQEFAFDYLQVGNVRIEIVAADDKVSSGPCGTVVYWNVENIKSSISALEAIGATLFRGPLNIENGESMCQMQDPWGNCIGLRGKK